MPSTTFNELMRPIQTQRNVLWLALTATIPIYAAVAWQIFGSAPPPADPLSSPDARPFTLLLALLALATAVAARWIPGLMLTGEQVRETLSRDPDLEALARNPRTGEADPEKLRRISSLPPEEQRLLFLAGQCIAPFVVQLALHEAIAIYGLVLAVLSQDFTPMLPFAAAAVLLNLTVSPKLGPPFPGPGSQAVPRP